MIISFVGLNRPTAKSVVDFSKENNIIDGLEAYEVLCPISSVTGCRENPLQLLKTLVNDPAKSRALDMILQDLPSMSSPSGASVDDLFASLQSVFVDSAFYEDDKFAERLMNISSDLLKSVGVEKPIEKVDKVVPSVSESAVPTAE